MKFSKPLIALSIGMALAGCNSDESSSTPSTPDAKTLLAAPFDLTIAHVNDTHSSFDPKKDHFIVDNTTVYSEFGGHPRLLTKANAYKEEAKENNDSLLFLHGGDAWQGSGYFVVNKGVMNAEILSQMGLDAMALGNHEFDLKNKTLNTFIGSVNFPVLAANIDTSKDANLKDQTNLKPYVVYAFDGNKKELITDLDNLPTDKQITAVFGLVLDDMPNWSSKTGDVEFKDLVASAQATVDMLKAKGINKIIALTHIVTDVKVASEVNGIDLIVGGHTHSLLGDFTNIGKTDNGTYAQMVKNPDGVGLTCVVQAGEQAQAIGKASVSFDADGDVTRCGGNNTLLNSGIFYHDEFHTAEYTGTETDSVRSFIEGQDNIAVTAEDKAMRALIESKYKPVMLAKYGDKIATVPSAINHERRPNDNGTDAHGSDVAPIFAEAQYKWANTPEALKLLNDNGINQVDFALINAGGIRTDIATGEMKEGNVTMELLPYANGMSIIPMTGEQVKDLLKVTIEPTLDDANHPGKFPYGGNLSYTFTETEVDTSGTLDSVQVNTINGWEDLDDSTTYNVAMNGYIATGYDDWTTMYDIQKESSGRVDLAYVIEGESSVLTAFPVDKIELTDKGGYKVIYQGTALNCRDAASFSCKTDQQAVVDYIKQITAKDTTTGLSSLTAITGPKTYEVVTLNRMPEQE